MYYMQSHADRHLRGMIVGEIEVATSDVNQSLEEHVSVFAEKADFLTEYFDGADLLSRQAVTANFDITMGSIGQTAILSGLPNPCMLYVNGQAFEALGGSYSLSLSVAGEYLVEVNEATYERQSWIVTAS